MTVDNGRQRRHWCAVNTWAVLQWIICLCMNDAYIFRSYNQIPSPFTCPYLYLLSWSSRSSILSFSLHTSKPKIFGHTYLWRMWNMTKVGLAAGIAIYHVCMDAPFFHCVIYCTYTSHSHSQVNKWVVETAGHSSNITLLLLPIDSLIVLISTHPLIFCEYFIFSHHFVIPFSSTCYSPQKWIYIHLAAPCLTMFGEN